MVAALTGIQTDRLKEEQKRGISIELGFAYFDMPDEHRCGIVDVPGHEKFVKQMIAGATGIDLVLMVVAADEGVMQQTREHMDICKLLKLKTGAIVLTKTDLVDDEWMELVESDLADFVEGTFLEGAPIVRFSAVDTSTHEPLREAIHSLAKQAEANRSASNENDPLRMAVDRVFTMKGFGTVVTGTVGSGVVATGDSVQLLPSGHKAKVRGIQSHNNPVDNIGAGHRTAINLQGIEREAIHRGDVLTQANTLLATRMLDVDLQLLSHVPRSLETQAKVLVHVGTSQVNGTVVLLDRKSLEPGETASAQLRLDEYVVTMGGDHLVIRGFDVLPTYGKTLGGGTILHPVPRKRRSGQPEILDALEALRSGNPEQKISSAAQLAGQAGITLSELTQVTSLPTELVKSTLSTLETAESMFRYVQDALEHFVHHEPFNELLEKACTIIDEYHNRFAHRAGMQREELRTQIRANMPHRFFAAIMETLEARAKVTVSEQAVRRSGFEPMLSTQQLKIKDMIYKNFDAGRLEPPPPPDVANDVSNTLGASMSDIKEMTDLLVADGSLHRVSESLVFGGTHIQWLEKEVTAFLEKNGEITTPQFKEITGTSRKFTVPLAEYLDARKLTIRVKDIRKLRKKVTAGD